MMRTVLITHNESIFQESKVTSQSNTTFPQIFAHSKQTISKLDQFLIFHNFVHLKQARFHTIVTRRCFQNSLRDYLNDRARYYLETI
jgi:hypothetical protein